MRCLIVDDVHPALFSSLEEAGIAYDYKPDWNVDTCMEKLPEYEGLVIRSRFGINKAIIDQCSKLQFIARAGAGLDNIDEKTLREKGVVLFHASEGNRSAVAEHTLGFILSLLNNMIRADDEVRHKIWKREENRGYELSSMTVGLIGYGNMGKQTARRLSSFGCKVLVFDKYKKNYTDKFARQVPLEQLKKEADIISLHIPLTEVSKFWMNSDFISSVSKPFWLINTSRGEIVNLEDLVTHIKTGKIRGAALDVLENEKLSALTERQLQTFEQLSSFRNVLLTPHIAGWTFESYKKISDVLGEKILKWKSGRGMD